MRTDTSAVVDLDGPTHYADFGGPAGAAPLVAVHGLGGSHANWVAVAPRLAADHRVLALDLAGHGLTRPDHRRTDVDANQALLNRFLREVVAEPAVLMGNSMGGLISILQASRHPQTVSALVLLDPAIPGPRLRHDRQVMLRFAGFGVPGLGAALMTRRRHRLSPRQQVQELLDLCCVDSARVPVDAVDRHVELAAQRQSFPGLERAFLDAARSVMLKLALHERLMSHMRAVDVPVLLLHGEQDRLVPAQAARRAAHRHPGWHVEIAPGLGHVPQLEAPDWTVNTYRRWRASLSVPSAHEE